MSSNTEMLEKIDLYFRGKLAPEEKEAFEKQMASDPELKTKMEISKIVDQMIVGKEAWNLKEQMKKDLNKPKSGSGKYMLILALLMTVSGIVFLFFNKEKNQTKISNYIQQQATPSLPLEIKDKTITSSGKHAQSMSKIIQPKIAKYKTTISTKADTTMLPKSEKIKTRIANFPFMDSKNEPLKQDSVIIKKINPCEGLRPEVESFVMPSCKGAETGEIHVNPETVKGGTPPYIFLLEDRKSSANFDRLSAGSYQLTIVDANNCTVHSNKGIVVPEKTCTQKQYVFNPEYDGSWEIPYARDKRPVKFLILDKGGRIFYGSQVIEFLPGGWNGESSTGSTLEMGVYFFEITYADGSIDHGSILISR
jgi:hypothetical protein